MRVVIVGGAMSGATMALALSKLTNGMLEIDVIEANLLDEQMHPGFDARAIAIADGTCKKLKKLNLWPHFSENSTFIKKVIVSDRGHLGRVEMNSEEHHVNALGHVVSLYDVGRSLWQSIKENEHIKIWAPYTIKSITRTQTKAKIELIEKRQIDAIKEPNLEPYSDIVIEADLIIAADGTNSKVAELLRFDKYVREYNQHGLIANIETSIEHAGQAFELFTDEGPLALLPMTDNRSTLVWCAKPETIASKMHLTDEAFLNDLQAHFGWRLGKLIKTGKRYSYPLNLTACSLPISHRTVLIGNAAQTLHPIAGQGFNLGMRDINTLAYLVADAVKSGRDIGEYSLLNNYLKQRQQDRERVIALTTRLVETFSTNSFGFVVGRNIGLSLLSQNPVLKGQIARQALGWVN
ncbi:2-octaprenyl-6-methoxyphenyl hydroxylase [Thorsellia anophelis]|uniref:2-octaprenyl-6-methoxyphenol hydroxylase n=1 Tax=Thorsellia anophelis DSM 18579 TaxID=1123402 RepID=A0A1I0A5U8_9GAMM|nr:2-octaprenyl-6-methoxyphenyl hydroxylase [Thorsellia anophelis]SES89521.1 2-octaprenyl-6-methoxyphenol hydroxylase [Thorsellia anophelis DSM 18579]